MFDRYIARRRGRAVARSYHEETGWYRFETDGLYMIAAGNGWRATLEEAQWHEYVNSAQNEMNRLARRDGVEPVYIELW